MADFKEDIANVFAVPDLWRTSTWLDQLPQDDANSFFSTKLDGNSNMANYTVMNFSLTTLDYTSRLPERFIEFEPTKPSKDGFFRLPQLEAHDEEKSAEHDITHDAQTEDIVSATGDEASDIWETLDRPAAPKPSLRTWDAFLNRAPSTAQPLLLTEAGSATYDAVLSWTIDPLELRNKDVPAVDAWTYFASLLALALGRESILFFKDEGGTSFRSALSHIRISGFSSDVLQGLQKQCFTSGKRLLDLRAFVQRTYSKNTSRCSVALASALDEALQAIQRSAVGAGQAPRSLLLLQATIKGISSILAPFHTLITRLDRKPSDEAIISIVYNDVCSIENGEPWLLEIMQEVLRRVSRPWLEFIEEWIGTRNEEGIALSKADIGASKGFVKVEAEAYVDDHGEEVEDVDFRLDRSKMPSFVPDDLAQAIFQTGRNMRFIRESHPEHPLSQPGAINISKPPKTDWVYDWDTILQLESEVSHYRSQLLDYIEDTRSHQMRGNAGVTPVAAENRPALDLFALDECSMEDRILASINHLNAPMNARATESRLGHIIQERLSGRAHLPLEINQARPHYTLLPVLSFGGIVAARAQVINRETMRELFRSHHLRGHLRLQREFQLLGNGLFSSRLSHALFDPDLERADRQAGVARQGGTMGLRLGGRDVWPPASSELTLALSGVLSESYHSGLIRIDAPTPVSRDDADLPGGLSFAVRDLSEEEIEKCMNPDSLEALDFLRLSYKAPSELHFIITPMVLMHYDRIFKLLVRVLRMIFITDFLWREAMSCREEDDEATYRFIREARHFVSSIASYFLDIGIAAPWKLFEDKLDKIQISLNTRQTEHLESPEQLRELHSNVLQTIMGALFLRKRQQPVSKLLDDVFSVILEYAMVDRLRRSGSAPSDAETPDQLYRRFKKKVQVFLTVCRGLTEKSRAATRKDDIGTAAMGDESMIAHLLIKLDIDNYYTK